MRAVVAQQVAAEMGRNGRMSGMKLARQSGVTYRTLMRCLDGSRAFTVDELARIAEVLDVPISALLGTASEGSTGRYFDDSLASSSVDDLANSQPIAA